MPARIIEATPWKSLSIRAQRQPGAGWSTSQPWCHARWRALSSPCIRCTVIRLPSGRDGRRGAGSVLPPGHFG
jgi:hypothetical protein